MSRRRDPDLQLAAVAIVTTVRVTDHRAAAARLRERSEGIDRRFIYPSCCL